MGIGDREDLVDDCVCGKVAVEALTAGHAEMAIHFATGLRGNAEGGTLAVGNVDGFDVATADAVEEVFDGTVDRSSGVLRWVETNAVILGEPTTSCEREVGHHVDAFDAFDIEPRGDLFGGERSQANCIGNVAKLFEGESYQRFLHHRYGLKYKIT